MFESVEEVQQRFIAARYIASRRIATVVFLAARMGRPVLVEGPAGVGKTELAKTLSDVTRRRLIRLQCYEGLDEGKALYEWKYAKQLLYTQLLRDRIGELIADAPSLPEAVAKMAGQEDAFFSFLPLAAPAPLRDPRRGARRPPRGRDRQGRARVRGVPARGAVGLPGLGPRARHGRGQAHPPRRAHVEQRARAVRRAQAAVPAPLHRLPRPPPPPGTHPPPVTPTPTT